MCSLLTPSREHVCYDLVLFLVRLVEILSWLVRLRRSMVCLGKSLSHWYCLRMGWMELLAKDRWLKSWTYRYWGRHYEEILRMSLESLLKCDEYRVRWELEHWWLRGVLWAWRFLIAGSFLVDIWHCRIVEFLRHEYELVRDGWSCELETLLVVSGWVGGKWGCSSCQIVIWLRFDVGTVAFADDDVESRASEMFRTRSVLIENGTNESIVW